MKRTALVLSAFLILQTAGLAQEPAPPDPVQYAVDPAKSVVRFHIQHLGGLQVRGNFTKTQGTFTLDDEDEANNRIDVSVTADSIDTKNRKRDQHLRSPDFFDVKQFPTIRFVSTNIQRIDARNYIAKGQMTCHGVTQPMIIRINRINFGGHPSADRRAGLAAVFKVNRKDFGITYGKLMGIGDEVQLNVALEGVRE